MLLLTQILLSESLICPTDIRGKIAAAEVVIADMINIATDPLKNDIDEFTYLIQNCFNDMFQCPTAPVSSPRQSHCRSLLDSVSGKFEYLAAVLKEKGWKKYALSYFLSRNPATKIENLRALYKYTFNHRDLLKNPDVLEAPAINFIENGGEVNEYFQFLVEIEVEPQNGNLMTPNFGPFFIYMLCNMDSNLCTEENINKFPRRIDWIYLASVSRVRELAESSKKVSLIMNNIICFAEAITAEYFLRYNLQVIANVHFYKNLNLDSTIYKDLLQFILQKYNLKVKYGYFSHAKYFISQRIKKIMPNARASQQLTVNCSEKAQHLKLLSFLSNVYLGSENYIESVSNRRIFLYEQSKPIYDCIKDGHTSEERFKIINCRNDFQSVFNALQKQIDKTKCTTDEPTENTECYPDMPIGGPTLTFSNSVSSYGI
eukprot:NODE_24_length_36516_cov_0.652470.p8 type:complete len:430 gc:universal NODE_24_length_36516_cov_0.652470:1898-3187(+)